MRSLLHAASAAVLLGGAACTPASHSPAAATSLAARAARVTIIRDDWGIAHVYGKTDADAVFGMIYAQAEDDFNRIEQNYLTSVGRMAEAEGEAALMQDLRQRLFMDSTALKVQFDRSPAWLQDLMVAWADGLNFYLAKHPAVKPRAITKFEPWMPLTYSEGSIGGDIESISLRGLEDFYGQGAKLVSEAADARPPEPTGSNGFAIAPANTADHQALLLINPHTSFFFRAELQMASEEGLNAYGAATWGQFFIYQGWNERLGWMHTSSGADAIDEFAETIVKRGDSLFYRVGNEDRPVTRQTITLRYRNGNQLATRDYTVYRTEHGPVVRQADGKWITVSLMHRPVEALTESFARTKAKTYQEFRKTVELQANSSNNTVYADADGNIAYFHVSFMPRRDTTLDWTRPVDGANPAAKWDGLLGLDQIPTLFNPANGWIQNTNNAPWTAAGSNSPRQKDFPSYMDRETENQRGIHAIRVLDGKKDFTLQGLIDAAFDSYQPAFALILPQLIRDYDHLPAKDPLKTKLAEQIKVLRGWDYRWGKESVATALAAYWGETFYRTASNEDESEYKDVYDYMARGAKPALRLGALAEASDKLTADFGTWKTPWGEINRFQRLTDDIVHPFNDTAPSIPVPFTSARWGSLASFGARWERPTRRFFGNYGNSFVAVVQFGDSVRARAVTAGGESGDPKSKHFNDQAERYASGDLRPVYFYRDQLKGHTEREYHPGE
ncbi:MAG TPA: penicillin acylase family protein [Gemmatimonadales bacterium]|nr:penicillin acylase family protein [Gemmatimonadales bacterium]